MNRPLGHCGAVSRATASSASGSACSARSQRADVLVAGGVPATARVRVAAALVLVAVDGVGLDRRSDVGDGLLGQAAVGRGERLPLALGRVHRLGEGDALDLARRPRRRPAGRRSCARAGRRTDPRRPASRTCRGPAAGRRGRPARAAPWRRPGRCARLPRRRGPPRPRVRTWLLAKPHAPSTRTRTPKPSLSPEATPSTRPLLMAIDSSSRRTTRASAYPAPRAVAVSRARSVRSRMRGGAYRIPRD